MIWVDGVSNNYKGLLQKTCPQHEEGGADFKNCHFRYELIVLMKHLVCGGQ